MLNIFDIIGPIMIGPSSSHTAGAARLGKLARTILGEPPKKVEITLYGSFAETGWGHGTNLALVAGLLGLDPWDEKLKEAYPLAGKVGLCFEFKKDKLKRGMHPNSVKFIMEGVSSHRIVKGASIGGGKIQITEIDGFSVSFSGSYPTIICIYKDRVGMIAEVSHILANEGVNIAQMKVSRDEDTQTALMLIETDQMPPQDVEEILKSIPDIKTSMVIPSI